MIKMVKIKIIIPSVGDNQNSFITSSFLFRSSKKGLFRSVWNLTRSNKDGTLTTFKTNRSTMNQFGEIQWQVTRPTLSNLRGEQDPVLTNASALVSNLLLTKVQDANFLNTITFRYKDGESIVVYGRKGSGHHIDGIKISKKDLATTLAKIIIRASFVRNVNIMDDYIDRVIHYPPNVLHAIENRSNYSFYNNGMKQEVLINTRVISETECALEISEVFGVLLP